MQLIVRGALATDKLKWFYFICRKKNVMFLSSLHKESVMGNA